MTRPEGWRLVRYSLSFWGVWPAWVMVASQWDVLRQAGIQPDWNLSFLTAGGTLAIYALDHFTEARTQSHLGLRHFGHPVMHLLLGLSTLFLLGLGLWNLDPMRLYWLFALSLSGLAYLLTTWGKIPYLPLLKEVLGAWCFTSLIWIPFGLPLHTSLPAIFLLGFANFLLASRQDTTRDVGNAIPSFSQNQPRTALWLARCAATGACLFFALSQPAAPLTFCALAHLAISFSKKIPVDAAFFPLLAVPFLLA